MIGRSNSVRVVMRNRQQAPQAQPALDRSNSTVSRNTEPGQIDSRQNQFQDHEDPCAPTITYEMHEQYLKRQAVIADNKATGTRQSILRQEG